MLPHFGAAYNLARWLTKDESRAEDVVQEAYLRAFSFFDSLRSNDSRPWLLSIVRNTCYKLMCREQAARGRAPFDEDFHEAPPASSNPELLYARSADHELLHRALTELPGEYREVLVLRELEDLSYKQISEATGLPMGTVMSRLSRARQRLQTILLQPRGEGAL